MIKSFFKRVFSSTSEVSATVETPTNEQTMTKDDQDSSPLQSYILLEIKLNWLESRSLNEVEDVVRTCYERTREGIEHPVRIQLRFDSNLQAAMEESMVARLREYLDLCEREIADFTFFLDKSDEATMDLYKNYLIPESIEQLNLFLRDRCMMIYGTTEALELDFQKEIQDFFGALQLPITSTFFEDFEQFKEQLLSNQNEFTDSDIEDTFVELPDEASIVTPAAPTMIEVSREEVENENIQQFDKFMEYALYSPEQAKKYEGSLLFSFYGFSRHEDLLRMMNRKEIKDWASILVEKHPYIFYFLNDEQYPMTKFLTSLVVTTEIENEAVYYNEEELSDFRSYIVEALTKLANWLQISETNVLEKFDRNFNE